MSIILIIYDVYSSDDTDYATDGWGLRSCPDQGTGAEPVFELMRWENSFTETLLRRLLSSLSFLLFFFSFLPFHPLLQSLVLGNMYFFFLVVSYFWLQNNKHAARAGNFLFFIGYNYIRMCKINCYGVEFWEIVCTQHSTTMDIYRYWITNESALTEGLCSTGWDAILYWLVLRHARR